MNMHLDGLLVADHHHRASHVADGFAHLRERNRVAFDHEVGAIPEVVIAMDVREGDGCHCGSGIRAYNLLAVRPPSPAVQNHRQPLTSSIDDARVAQLFELAGGIGDRLLGSR